MTTSGRTKAEQVGDSRWLEMLARVGLISYGVVYLLIGWLALQLAWGAEPHRSPDPSGAFRTLAAQPLGNVLLWLVAVGLAALGLWRGSDAVWGHRRLDGADRVRMRVSSAGRAMVYTGLGARSAVVASGLGAGTSHSEKQATIGVLAWPGGRAIVITAGITIISVGVVEAIRGLKKSFRKEIDTSSLREGTQKCVLHLGQVGYLAKGLALGMVGGLLSYAAWTFDLRKASGLDGALQTLLTQPFGRWLLSMMAVGFVAFGAFGILQFRYRRM